MGTRLRIERWLGWAAGERHGEPVDPASLVAFRVLFGLLMFAGTLRFFARGWVEEHFLEPRFFFAYEGLSWVKPWPGAGMYVHFALMALSSLGIASGLFYRASALLFGLLFSYAHLVDKTHYLNHYYLVSLLALLVALMPLHRVASLDVARGAVRPLSAMPAWPLWLLRFQVGVVYVFGGIAKLNHDWLFEAQPMTIWLGASTDFPLVGPLFARKEIAYLASWAGAVFDLSVVPLLLWRRSRPFALGAAIVFHVTTWRLFPIGMFPWIMLTGALLFLSPSWPRRLLALGNARLARPALVRTSSPPCPLGPAARAALTAYVAIQLLVPLRHLAYPGSVCWTEEGFRFSWNVMRMEKNGSAEFRVVDARAGREKVVDLRDYLTPLQAKMMSTQPDMLLAFGRHLAESEAAEVRVHAEVHVSLNGRPAAPLVDPKADLARAEGGLAPGRWLLPAPEARPLF